jgi:hypothetical protein
MRRLLLLATLLAAPPVLAAEPGPGQTPVSPPTIFDAPLKTERITLPKTRGEPADKRELTCFRFAELRVKQLDLGEVGAAQLAILPQKAGAKPTPCQRQTAAGEIVIPAKAWSGYFKGVKSNYVFFDAEDGTNGGLGFAVFDGRTGTKLFEDLAVGEIGTAEPSEDGIKLRYKRAFSGTCSIPAAGVGCWAEILQKMPGVKAEPIPDCAAGYLKAKSEMARGRCEAQNEKGETCLQKEMKLLDEQKWDTSPSVIGYDVEARIKASQPSVTATGGELSCWPAD